LQLCWAGYDLPARPYDRMSLLDITKCECETFSKDDGPEWTRVEIHGDTSVGSRPPEPLSIIGPPGSLQAFGEALQQLIESRETEGQKGLEFIQKRLFQYLWMNHGHSRTETELIEAEAVLAFNIDPKGEGVPYLKAKLNMKTEHEIGQWLALMATQKGGLSPTMLGEYFSRRDTLEIFRAFVRCTDFGRYDIVVALRKLFDTFKPGGEGQVITRILEYFAEAYFDQWKACEANVEPRVAYDNPDSVLSVAVSLIMLNTGLHVATKKVGKKACVPMTIEQYISNTRGVVKEEEVPDAALRVWFDAVSGEEISVEPLPRAAFSQLPVQPRIEGWLIAVMNSQTQVRLWVVLALQRMYLFQDSSDAEPGDAIDLKDISVRGVDEDEGSKERFAADLRKKSGGPLCQCFGGRDRSFVSEIQDAEGRAFELSQQATDRPTILSKLSKSRFRLVFVAEDPNLMSKWVSLIAAGPY